MVGMPPIRTMHLVHDVGRGGVHGVHKALGQVPVFGQDLPEVFQLLFVGQAAEQQQPDHFLKHKAVVAVGLIHDLIDVDAAVNQPAGNRDDMAFLVFAVAHNVTDIGQARQDAGAIRVSQAALDAQPLAGLGVNIVVGQILLAEGLHGFMLFGSQIGHHDKSPSLFLSAAESTCSRCRSVCLSLGSGNPSSYKSQWMCL